MSIIAGTLLALSFTGCEDDSVLKDVRDGKVYRVLELGNHIWMAENLNYAMSESFCYNTEPAYCEKYGRLYTWSAAMKACPEGWHLPSREELDELFAAAGGTDVAGRLLKSATGWKGIGGKGNGDDGYGFTAPPAGYRGYNGHYYLLGERVNFWSSTKGENDDAYNVNLHASRNSGSKGVNFVGYAYSVRCVKNMK